MKKFFAGLVLGVVFGSFTLVFAQESFTAYKAWFPIFINNVKYENNDKPIVTIDGSTYVPLKALADVLKVNAAWNEEKKQVEVASSNGVIQNSGTTVSYLKDKIDFLNVKYTLIQSSKMNVLNGEIKNNDTIKHSFTYKVTFYDKNKNIVDTILQTINDLNPSEVRTFMVLPKNPSEELEFDVKVESINE